jgi:CRISPR/Cas system CSM-associated protein Csm2 small subunit
MFDETFPKMARRAYSLGVAMCEHGLIRSVRSVTRQARDIPAQLRQTVGEHFRPAYFLTDLAVLYSKFMRAAGLDLIHLRDIVHLIRQIIRLFDDAVREVTLDVPKGLPLKERKKQRRLKRRLLHKRLQPMLTLVFKAFSPGYESVCVLMLEGVISQLEDPTIIIQTASVQRLARRLRRFVKKHAHTINLLLQLSVEQGTPTTTNGLESKNSIFKPFSFIAKFFSQPDKCQSFFAGIALMENFDVKTRGPNKGTSAMQRAGINLEDFGATDFFSAVGLPKPRISLAYITAYGTIPYLSSWARIQEDRGHVVVTEGLYRHVRHPMYLGIILGFIGIPLSLGSWWALIPSLLIATLFVYRTAREDRMLMQGLPGYEEYAQKVRYRLLPGIW